MTKPTSVYIASRYSRRREMEQHAHTLIARGWRVTARWVFGQHEQDNRPAAIYADEDRQDVAAADWLLAFTEDAQQDPGYTKGGRHVEFGIALALDKKIIIVGPRENVFYHLPNIRQADTFEQALLIMEQQTQHHA